MFDIAALDTATLANAGVAMPIINPKTRQVATDSAGNAVTITLRGRNSELIREVVRKHDLRRVELLRQGNKLSLEEMEEQEAEMLAVCTVTWSFTEVDGQPFPPTPENVNRFWRDPRFRSIREQASVFVSEDANFMRG